MISSVLKELTDAAAAGRLVTLIRRGEMEKATGVPLAVGTRLVLLRHLNPEMLLPDGHIIVRVQDVVEVRVSDWDRAVARALAAESLGDSSEKPAVRLDGWAGALAYLHARGARLSLDCEDEEEGYFLGILTAVGEASAGIRHIATDGTWEDEDWTVDFDGITRVTFGTRYVEVFARLAGDLP